MTKTIIAVYNSVASAKDAVQNLINTGIDRQNISLVTYDENGQYANMLEGNQLTHLNADVVDDDVKAGEGAAFGALAGLAIGLGALAIPGIGPVIAAGPIASALTGAAVGAVAGAATGGIVAALVDMGVPEEEAQVYAESVRRGGAAVIVKAPDQLVGDSSTIMSSAGPIDVERSAQKWRQSGWNRFDEKSQPYTPNRERDFERSEQSADYVRSYDEM
jgi:hypothetical protein